MADLRILITIALVLIVTKICDAGVRSIYLEGLPGADTDDSLDLLQNAEFSSAVSSSVRLPNSVSRLTSTTLATPEPSAADSATPAPTSKSELSSGSTTLNLPSSTAPPDSVPQSTTTPLPSSVTTTPSPTSPSSSPSSSSQPGSTTTRPVPLESNIVFVLLNDTADTSNPSYLKELVPEQNVWDLPAPATGVPSVDSSSTIESNSIPNSEITASMTDDSFIDQLLMELKSLQDRYRTDEVYDTGDAN